MISWTVIIAMIESGAIADVVSLYCVTKKILDEVFGD